MSILPSDAECNLNFQPLSTLLETFCSEFEKVWKDYGYSDYEQHQRLTIIQSSLHGFLTHKLMKERDCLDKKRKEIDCTIKRNEQLVKDLQLNQNDDPLHKMLNQGEILTLLQKEEALEHISLDLQYRKADRIESYSKVHYNVEQLTFELLGNEHLIDNTIGIPTVRQIDDMNKYYHTLVQERAYRKKTYRMLRSKIRVHFHILEKQPGDDLEHVVIEGNPESFPFPLTSDVMKKLEELEFNLRSTIDHNRQDVELLTKRIQYQWERLKTDRNIITAFMKANPWRMENQAEKTKVGSEVRKGIAVFLAKPSLVATLKMELSRLEEEERQKRSSILKCRSDLLVLWEKCFVNLRNRYSLSAALDKNSKSPFTHVNFISESFTDDLMVQHLKEIEKWSEYVEDNKELLRKVSTRQRMWADWKKINLQLDDPSRNANGGGDKEKQQKERKILGKSILKFDKEITELNIKHEELYGVRFFFRGADISSKIAHEWKSFEQEKNARQNAGIILVVGKSTTTRKQKRQASLAPSTISSSKRGKDDPSTPMGRSTTIMSSNYTPAELSIQPAAGVQSSEVGAESASNLEDGQVRT